VSYSDVEVSAATGAMEKYRAARTPRLALRLSWWVSVQNGPHRNQHSVTT